MDKFHKERGRRILTLLKLDVERLFSRVYEREHEYLALFSLRRTREHFRIIFKNRYESMGVNELKYCSEDVLIGLDSFYSKIEELRWYLFVTEDMPGTVENNVSASIKELKPIYDTLILFLEAELTTQIDEESIESDVMVDTPKNLEENLDLEDTDTVEQ